MKKIFISLLLLFITHNALASTVIKGSISADKVDEGYGGTWHVTSKLIKSNNPSKFNSLSVDIWNLSKQGNDLILQNPISGASSAITITEAKNNVLTFERTTNEDDIKVKETPSLILKGDIFTGYDTMVVETFKNTKLIDRSVVKYKLVGQKISGESITP